MMRENGTDQAQDILTLRGRLSEIAELAPWIESLALRHTIPPDVQFAIALCLEEVISNAICHGYGGEKEDRSVVVRFIAPRDQYIVFLVEDEAPPFNPLDAPELPPLNPHEEMRIGGQGLRLLRRFAGTLEYEQMPGGNRLRLGFSTAGSSETASATTDSTDHQVT
ncbi:MAG TPA: ATP-binding protein [Acidobacteriaceae bacterium]|jgi:anti-sigma regulatory factor (Ser/Thr protein kinase)